MSSASGRKFMQPGYELRQLKAAETFLRLYTSKFKHICIENPRGHLEKFITATQEVHPYYFGDAYLKRTRLFLKNLPLLQHNSQPDLFTKNITSVEPKFSKVACNRSGSFARSVFHPNMAEAMATQWVEYIKNSNI